ncbi:UDP-N-acetylmuramate--L-alanine ligase [Segetibacter sp. 3557_3]|uniref:UDP-N-acetylmuramate--L-alanine ligase n=1 Tax=Segetibacter sp. 3557_3 TaxID=2547429 RepID=UPI001058C02C|nr:UDP-N-acetylmuramate--L-alanine ligase [Segetibacter sp. 3557_3]TDH22986.1 UDP-N-acetylmuramate--L-alanine ligase [Segetibacter sp. 3557_3]
MTAIKTIQRLYFIGIGGIGMSAIARYFLSLGAVVSGYDRTQTPLTDALVAEGASIHFTEDVELIPKEVDLVVYTPAVPAHHAELMYYWEHGYKVVKRSDVLQIITESSFNICVAGTHGKTTISTMIAHVLRHSGYGCNAFLGGISTNYQTNFWSNARNVCVLEADEYDRSFLKLVPDIAVISATDPDHLDIYGTPEEVEKAFVEFAGKLKPGGCLISKHGLNKAEAFQAAEHLTYSLNHAGATVYAEKVKVLDGAYVFDVISNDWHLNNIVLQMGGLHNVENIIPAITIAKRLNIRDEKIRAAVKSFEGVKRRFEFIIKESGRVFIDDYAHHPEELKALITGVKSLYQQPMVLVFQPHLFSRTKDLAVEFAQSLDMADEVILLPIYPAREQPVEGVTSELILQSMKNESRQVLNKAALQDWIKANKPHLLVTAGAGDIDALVQPIKAML